MVVEKKLDLEVLGKKDNLSEEDFNSIQAQVLAEEEAESGSKKKEDPEIPEDDQEKPKDQHKDEGDEETAEEKTAREKKAQEDADAEAENVAAENKRILEAREEDLNDEEKETRKGLLEAEEKVKAEKEAQDKKLKEDVEAEVKAYATEHKISEEEARSDFESREKILEKYKSEPKQLAMANLHLQRLYTATQEKLKAQEEAKPLQAASEISSDVLLKLLDDGKIMVAGKAINREQAVDIYRKENPEVENLDDESILKLVAKDIRTGIVNGQKQNIEKRSAEAKEKRAAALKAIPETDKKYLPAIQALIEKYPDKAILSDHFDVTDLINYEKGKHYDQDLKEHGEKEYKRGLAQAKIVGIRPGSEGSQRPKSKAGSVSLTAEQKAEALSMYEGTVFTDEEKFANYAECMLIGKEKK